MGHVASLVPVAPTAVCDWLFRWRFAMGRGGNLLAMFAWREMVARVTFGMPASPSATAHVAT